jgi:hypothetical protein
MLRRSIELILGLLLIAPIGATGDEESQKLGLKGFYSQVQILVHKYYPNATSSFLRENIHFEHDTRIFIVHEMDKMGRWQDPSDERGPKPGGIYCDMSLEPGRFEGAAMVPQTFDRYYFKVLLLAPYSAKRDAHLTARLVYPANVDQEFLKQFTDLVNGFEKYLD